MKKEKYIYRDFVFRVIILTFFVVLGYGTFVAFKVYRLQKKVIVINSVSNSEENQPEPPGIIETVKTFFSSDKRKLVGEENGRINLLLVGMGGEGHKGKYLTDTIMLVSVQPGSYKSSMLSIPRDLFVQIPDQFVQTKINAIYTYGLRNQSRSSGEAMELLKKTVAEITGQEVHYYIALDFEGFESIINQLGGIDVEVEHDIYDPRYPGPNYSYQTFEIKKGWHHLDADTALKYARVRHTKGGDFGRAARQQQVLAAVRKKAFSLGTLLNPVKLSHLMDSLGEHLKTDIALADLPGFLHYVDRVNIYQTTSRVLDAWSENALLASTHVELGGVWAYVLLPRARNYSEVRELVGNIFQLDQLQKKQEEIKKEDADLIILAENINDYHRIQRVFKKLGYQVAIRSSLNEVSCGASDSIISYGDQKKIFTLDDLAAKLNTTVQYREKPVENFDYDILICLSSASANYFYRQNQQQQEEKYLEQSIIRDDGDVLVK